MPRIRRHSKRKRVLESQHIIELITGHDFFNDAFRGDEEWRREAWRELREYIMNFWNDPNQTSMELAGSVFERERWVARRKLPWAEERYGKLS